jgi:hypothetical protein
VGVSRRQSPTHSEDHAKQRKKARKSFFSEEKKQKTFASLACPTSQAMAAIVAHHQK